MRTPRYSVYRPVLAAPNQSNFTHFYGCFRCGLAGFHLQRRAHYPRDRTAKVVEAGPLFSRSELHCPKGGRINESLYCITIVSRLQLTCILKSVVMSRDFPEFTSPTTPTAVYLASSSRRLWTIRAHFSQRAMRFGHEGENVLLKKLFPQ